MELSGFNRQLATYNNTFRAMSSSHSSERFLRMFHRNFCGRHNSVDGLVSMVKTKFPEVRLLSKIKRIPVFLCEQSGNGRQRRIHSAFKSAYGCGRSYYTFESTAFMDAHPMQADWAKMLDGKGKFFYLESKRGLPNSAVAFIKYLDYRDCSKLLWQIPDI